MCVYIQGKRLSTVRVCVYEADHCEGTMCVYIPGMRLIIVRV